MIFFHFKLLSNLRGGKGGTFLVGSGQHLALVRHWVCLTIFFLLYKPSQWEKNHGLITIWRQSSLNNFCIHQCESMPKLLNPSQIKYFKVDRWSELCTSDTGIFLVKMLFDCQNLSSFAKKFLCVEKTTVKALDLKNYEIFLHCVIVASTIFDVSIDKSVPFFSSRK